MLLYFAVQQINIFADGLEGLFAIVWLIFSLFVFAGNMVGLLFATAKQTKRAISQDETKINKRLRSDYGS